MAIKLEMVIIVWGGSSELFQYAIIFAMSEPIVIPGHDDRPKRIINAKAIPEGGHVGKAVVFSNAKK
jgi:hypothetical protein